MPRMAWEEEKETSSSREEPTEERYSSMGLYGGARVASMAR
jgi:hypothetical protein